MIAFIQRLGSAKQPAHELQAARFRLLTSLGVFSQPTFGIVFALLVGVPPQKFIRAAMPGPVKPQIKSQGTSSPEVETMNSLSSVWVRKIWRSFGAFSFGAFSESAQSMTETALLLPILLILALNTINFGYFFFMAVNLASAPRQGVEYSVQGFNTPSAQSFPSAGPCTTTATNTVSYLTYDDMSGMLGGVAPCSTSTNNASVQVCSQSVGLTNRGQTNQTAQCQQFGPPATFAAPASDPESPGFVLHRVDVQYTVTPLIKSGIFNLVMPTSLSFHRQVSMRAVQ